MAAMTVGLLDAFEQPDQGLDARDHVLGLLAVGRALVRRDRRSRLEDAHLQRLVATSALGDPELDPGARLERGHPGRQRGGVDVDVCALLTGEEAEALLRV